MSTTDLSATVVIARLIEERNTAIAERNVRSSVLRDVIAQREQAYAARDRALAELAELRAAVERLAAEYDTAHHGIGWAGRSVAERLRALPSTHDNAIADRPRSWRLPDIPDDVTRVTSAVGTYERDEHDPRVWWPVLAGGQRIPARISTGGMLTLADAANSELIEVPDAAA